MSSKNISLSSQNSPCMLFPPQKGKALLKDSSKNKIFKKILRLKSNQGSIKKSLPMSVYHLHFLGLSKSGIHTIYKNTLFEYFFKTYLKKKNKKSKSLDIGTLFHLLFCEAHKFDDEYAVWEGRRQGKIWENFQQENTDRIIITKSELNQANEMLRASLTKKLSKAIYDQKGEVEYSYFYREPKHDVLLKCRPDKFIPSLGWVIDIKTSKNNLPLSYKGFQYEAYIYGYYVSAALTLMIMEKVLGKRPEAYFYLAVSNVEPYRSFLYKATEEEIQLGNSVIEKVLPEFKKALDSDVWPDYEDKIYECGLPGFVENVKNEINIDHLTQDDFRSAVNG